MGRPQEDDVVAELRRRGSKNVAGAPLLRAADRIEELEGAHKRVGEALLSLDFMDAVERGDLVGARRVVNRAALSECDDV